MAEEETKTAMTEVDALKKQQIEETVKLTSALAKIENLEKGGPLISKWGGLYDEVGGDFWCPLKAGYWGLEEG